MSRYFEATDDLIAVFNKLLSERFFTFAGLKFKLLFDSKKRMSKGRLVLASTDLVSEKVRFLTADDVAPNGYDYFITVNSLAWQHADEESRYRLLSHELNHVFIDEKGKLKLVGHDVEDFALEINRNLQNPNWALNLESLTLAIYEQDEELEAVEKALWQ